MTIERLLTDTERRWIEAQRLLGLAEALLTDESERTAREHVKNALRAFETLRDGDSTPRHRSDGKC